MRTRGMAIALAAACVWAGCQTVFAQDDAAAAEAKAKALAEQAAAVAVLGRDAAELVLMAEAQAAGQAAPAEPAQSAEQAKAAEERARERAERDRERGESAREQSERERERAEAERDRASRGKDRQERAYERALNLLDRREWQAAADAFAGIATAGAERADAALYWQAYALNRIGRRSEALAALGTLSTKYKDSRWLQEAKALEAEVRQASGQAPNPDAGDDDLKLMALNSLMNSDPERAVPMLETILAGTGSRKLKERALFVLAQADSERAREVMSRIARGGANPDVQLAAIRNLGIHGGAANQKTLSEIYAQSSDPAVKRQVLQAFMISGAKGPVLEAARNEKAPELRADAIRQLGVMGAHAELDQLYQTETSVELRKQILQAMFIGGQTETLAKLAKTEKNAELRGTAVRNLGLTGKQGSSLIVGIYESETDAGVRKQAIEALFVSGEAGPLVALARKEKDPEMKRQMVQKLSHMQSKEATDYMLEILGK